MTQRDLHELGEAEQALSRAAVTGELVDLRVGSRDGDDPCTGDAWGPERTVRADVLYALLTAESTTRAVVLRGARISGAVNLESARLDCPLILEGCRFDGPVNVRDARAETIRLSGCRLPCLHAALLETRGDLNLDRTSAAIIDLIGARIGGQLSLEGASLSGGSWPLDLEGATLAPFDDVTTDATRLRCAALVADGLRVQADMLCRDGFDATGEIRLLGAHIHGQLSLDKASITSERGPALNADRITVEQSVLCRDGFAAVGEVRLVGSRIHGQLSFEGARLRNAQGPALNLQETDVRGSVWLRFGAIPEGTVDLRSARMGALYDSEPTWSSHLYIRGLIYGDLEAAPELSVTGRLRWIARDPAGYAPQPYEQLVEFYRRAGSEGDARRVAIEKQRRRRGTLTPAGKVGSLALGAIVGHGYRAWLAGVWLLVLWGVGSVLFDSAYPQHFTTAKPAGEMHNFQPTLYTLDLLLPIVDLHQHDAWIADGPAQLGALLTIAGWVLATAAIAAVTGLIRKD